jgi:hypothetical protein
LPESFFIISMFYTLLYMVIIPVFKRKLHYCQITGIGFGVLILFFSRRTGGSREWGVGCG